MANRIPVWKRRRSVVARGQGLGEPPMMARTVGERMSYSGGRPDVPLDDYVCGCGFHVHAPTCPTQRQVVEQRAVATIEVCPVWYEPSRVKDFRTMWGLVSGEGLGGADDAWLYSVRKVDGWYNRPKGEIEGPDRPGWRVTAPADGRHVSNAEVSLMHASGASVTMWVDGVVRAYAPDGCNWDGLPSSGHPSIIDAQKAVEREAERRG